MSQLGPAAVSDAVSPRNGRSSGWADIGDARSLAHHLVIALAEDFALAEVADILDIAARLARKAIEIRDRRDQLRSGSAR